MHPDTAEHGFGALPSSGGDGEPDRAGDGDPDHAGMQWLPSLMCCISKFIRQKPVDDIARPPRKTVSKLELRTRQSIIFENPSMLRATSAFHVLQRFGALFQDSAGSAETYALSEPVNAIDAFVSHNWSTDRTEKYRALALYFNSRDALIAAVIGAAVAALLTALQVLPTFAMHPDLATGRVSIASRVMGATFLILTLFLGHEIKGRFGCSGPRLFVDKAVIHQTDTELKRAGIRHLAGFLAHSKRMVIVYTPETYFKRLWTVYELASMLVLQPSHRITVIPASLPKLVLRASPLWLFFSLLSTILRTKPVWGLVGSGLSENAANALCIAIFFIPFGPIALMQRHWEQQCREMWNSVRHFSIQSTECSCEEDRTVVFGNIAAFMRDFAFVEPGASEAEALEAFNAFVRSRLPVALGASGGHTAIPYKYAVVLFVAELMYLFDAVGAGSLDGTARDCCIWAVFYAATALAVLPSMVIVCQWGSRDMNPFRCTLKLLAFGCTLSVLMLLLHKLALLSLTSDGWLQAYLGMVGGCFAVAAFLYRPRVVMIFAPMAKMSVFLMSRKMVEHQAPEPIEINRQQPPHCV